jgi:hypothetical protein
MGYASNKTNVLFCPGASTRHETITLPDSSDRPACFHREGDVKKRGRISRPR